MINSEKMKCHPKHHGFTLIEMLVTVSIAAILASMAVPSFSEMIERNRISSASNEFLSALMLTRSEAVKRSQVVSICVSNALQTECDNTIKDYAKGWLIFTDCNGNGVLDNANTEIVCDTDAMVGPDTPEVLVKVHDELPHVLIQAPAGELNEDLTTYDFSGRVGGVLNFHVGKDFGTSIPTPTPSPVKTISLGRTGRAQVCDFNAAGCI